jgi:serine/threonine protein phosphatase PrpC
VLWVGWGHETTAEFGTEGVRLGVSAAAERIGVFAEPEILATTLGPDQRYLVLASDGVFEFLKNQAVIDLVCSVLVSSLLSVLTSQLPLMGLQGSLLSCPVVIPFPK